MVLSGDMHSFWAIDASEDTFLNRKTELIEFVSSSVSANWPEPLSNPVQVNLKKNIARNLASDSEWSWELGTGSWALEAGSWKLCAVSWALIAGR